MTREMMVSIVIAVSVLMSAHGGMAAYRPNSRSYGSFGKRSHIVGRDGLCLDTITRPTAEKIYTPTQLSPCEAGKNSQLWNIFEDGTVRSLDSASCLVPYSDAYEAKAVLRACSEVIRTDKKWNHKKDGSFVHDNSGYVLTAKPDNFVILGKDENTPCQSWETTDNLYPFVSNIKWLQDQCLQSIDQVSFPYLNICDKNNKNQHWAMYPDGTIRVDAKRDHCLTSQRTPSSAILVSKCVNMASQRWGINEKNFIYHPNTDMVLDVDRKPEGSQIVVIKTRDDTPTQEWILY